jgi:hypothetical protein
MLLSVIHKNTTLTSGGAVFAGSVSGTSGSDDGTGSNARFSSPSGIVADGDGNFYVSDSANHTIRKVTRFGVVTTHFGTAGTSGNTLTTLNSPRGLALDSGSNLYIADYSNNRVLRLANGAATATNLGLVKFPDEIAVNSDGTQAVFKSALSTGANLIQYRNGVIEGVINTVFNEKPYNIASVACAPNGNFYYCSKDGQFTNQIGVYKMTQQPANNRELTVTATGVYQPYGCNATSGIFIDVDPTLAPVVAVGSKFILSGFDTPAGLNGFSANVTGKYSVINYDSNSVRIADTGILTFDYTGSNYPVGIPDIGFVKHSQCNSGYKYRVLAIGWDKLAAPFSNAPSPEEVLRMNFYVRNRTYSFPSIQPNTGVYLTTIETGTTSFEGFTGEFTSWNSLTASGLQIYDYPAGSEVVFGGTGNLSFVNNMTAANFEQNSPEGGYIFGPNIKSGTVVTQYTHGTPGIIRTNQQWAYMSPAQADVAIALSPNDTDTKTFTVPVNTKVLPGMRIKGSSADGVTILSVSFDFPSVRTGTIKTEYPFDTVPVTTTETIIDPRSGEETTITTTTNNSFTLDASYEFGAWTGGSSRVVQAIFTKEDFPGSTGANRKCTLTSIQNNPTGVYINGGLYGTYIDNMHFSRTDNSILYASFQGYDGIARYNVVEPIGPLDFYTGNVDSITTVDSNVEIPKPSKFTVSPTSSELIGLVPEAGSNHIKIYENEY